MGVAIVSARAAPTGVRQIRLESLYSPVEVGIATAT